MVLAAGLGRRMAPLTDHTPKPLLSVGGRALIDHHLMALSNAGCTRVVVNTAHLGGQVRAHVTAWGAAQRAAPDGRALDVRAIDEGPKPLETGGGIVNALDALGAEEFVVVNGDVFTDFDFHTLVTGRLDDSCDARLVLVPNPGHHPRGDFTLMPGGILARATEAGGAYTYAGIARLHRRLFDQSPPVGEHFPLAPLLYASADAGRLRGERFDGTWIDVGTPERLLEADRVAMAATGAG